MRINANVSSIFLLSTFFFILILAFPINSQSSVNEIRFYKHIIQTSDEIPNYITINFYHTVEIGSRGVYKYTDRYVYANTESGIILINFSKPVEWGFEEGFRPYDINLTSSGGNVQYSNRTKIDKKTGRNNSYITINATGIEIESFYSFFHQISFKLNKPDQNRNGYNLYKETLVSREKVNSYEYVVILSKRPDFLHSLSKFDFYSLLTTLELGSIQPRPDNIYETKDNVEITFKSDENRNFKELYYVPIEIEYKYSINYSAFLLGLMIFLFSSLSIILMETLLGNRITKLKEKYNTSKKVTQALILFLIILLIVILMVGTLILGDIRII